MTDTTWEPDWCACAACGNIAVAWPSVVCDICQNEEGES